LYDLGKIYIYKGSTHGTYVNKKKLPSKVYHKLNVYDSIKFGNSTRQYVLRSY
jgi:pSer/pThr/pTyr-binding forkhead associated (FHA) protein